MATTSCVLNTEIHNQSNLTLDCGSQTEVPVPEQFLTVVKGNKLHTTINEVLG